MFRFILSLMGTLLAACLVQLFIPVLSVFWDTRVLLIAIVFLVSALALPTPGMLLMAFVSGLLWDMQRTILFPPYDGVVYPAATSSLPFGISIIFFGVLGFIVQGVQPLFRSGSWRVSLLAIATCLFLYQIIEIMTLSFVRGRFLLTEGVLIRISLTALITCLLTPLLFWLTSRLAEACNYQLLTQQNRRPARYH